MKHCAVGVCSSPVHCEEIGRCFSSPPSEPVKLVSNQPLPRTDIVPGKMHCAKCGFTLQRVSLFVLSGTVGAGGNETEACPNDGNPMLPVTWEEEAREAWKRCEEMLERAVKAETVLRELTALKDLKDRIVGYDAGSTQELAELADDYGRRKPGAWAAARALLLP